MVIKHCEQCEKTFDARKARRFCSSSCWYLWASENRRGRNCSNWKDAQIARVCEHCGDSYKSYKGKNEKFCSIACRTSNWKGENHPRWNRIIRKCKQCYNAFEIKQYRNESASFCSVECKQRWHGENFHGKDHPLWNQEKRICEVCNKEFETAPSHVARFCSLSCFGQSRVGEKASNWRGGISFDPYPITFNNSFKRLVRDRDNYTCAVCWHPGKDVHHIDYNKQNTVSKNCITLCRSCHTTTGGNRIYWEAVFVDMIAKREMLNG